MPNGHRRGLWWPARAHAASKERGGVRGSLSVVPIIFVRRPWATTAAWVHGGLAVVLSKRPFRVFRLVTCPNFKFEMTNGRPLGDVTYEGQGRGHRPTRRPEEYSENAVHMLRKWTGTCQGRWCGILMVLCPAQNFVPTKTAVMVQVSRPHLNQRTATWTQILTAAGGALAVLLLVCALWMYED